MATNLPFALVFNVPPIAALLSVHVRSLQAFHYMHVTTRPWTYTWSFVGQLNCDVGNGASSVVPLPAGASPIQTVAVCKEFCELNPPCDGVRLLGASSAGTPPDEGALGTCTLLSDVKTSECPQSDLVRSCVSTPLNISIGLTEASPICFDLD